MNQRETGPQKLWTRFVVILARLPKRKIRDISRLSGIRRPWLMEREKFVMLTSRMPQLSSKDYSAVQV